MKVDADLPHPLAGVFNASDNLGKLHRLEKSAQEQSISG